MVDDLDLKHNFNKLYCQQKSVDDFYNFVRRTKMMGRGNIIDGKKNSTDRWQLRTLYNVKS